MSEFNTDAQNIEARKVRLGQFESILKEQFQLAYFGRIGYDASDTMGVNERHTLYRILVEQKKEERKAHEEALKNAKANKNGSRGWKRKK